MTVLNHRDGTSQYKLKLEAPEYQEALRTTLRSGRRGEKERNSWVAFFGGSRDVIPIVPVDFVVLAESWIAVSGARAFWIIETIGDARP
jgi:hypothetical protein